MSFDEYNATLVEQVQVAHGLKIVKVKPDEGEFEFKPGQYATLGIMPESPRAQDAPPEAEIPKPGRLIKRPFSISSSADVKDSLEFYVAIVPDGQFTSRFDLLNPGERIYLAPKVKGTFTLDAIPDGASLSLVSTGTGLGPYISMLRTEGFWEKFKSVSVVHGVRYVTDFAYKDELQSLADSRKSFSYYQIVSRPDASWNGKKGYVQKLFEEELVSKLNPEQDHIMVCGNPGMIEGMTELLVNYGYTEHTRKDPGNLHLEKYWTD